MELSRLCKPSTPTNGIQDSAQTDLRSGCADPSSFVWPPNREQKRIIIMNRLGKVYKASGHTAADFCTQIGQAWLSLGGMRWPDQKPEGLTMDCLFGKLCRELEDIRTSGLVPQDVQKKTVAELVSPLCVHYWIVRCMLTVILYRARPRLNWG